SLTRTDKKPPVSKVAIFDMDGIIVNLYKSWLALYNRDYDDNLDPGDLNDFYVENCVKPECGIKVVDYLDQPGLFRNAEPMPGAIENLRMMKESGIHVV